MLHLEQKKKYFFLILGSTFPLKEPIQSRKNNIYQVKSSNVQLRRNTPSRTLFFVFLERCIENDLFAENSKLGKFSNPATTTI